MTTAPMTVQPALTTSPTMPTVGDLLRRRWDVVVVGGGHNGLVCAAYLARAGQQVLVVERRDRFGGACAAETPWPGYTVSAGALMVGLLDRRIVTDLDLARHGYRLLIPDLQLWCPFPDGTAVGIWTDPARTAAHLAAIGVAAADIRGLRVVDDLVGRLWQRLRHGTRDTWVGEELPSRAGFETLVADDPELVDLLFAASTADLLERHVRDERLRAALWPDGAVGIAAGPRHPGTAAMYATLGAGDLDGHGPWWGYVRGGMGRLAGALAGAATAAGAALVAGVPVGAIRPGEGVELASGEVVHARVVVCNADPHRTLALCGDHLPSAWRQRLQGWRLEGTAMRLNCALRRPPRPAVPPPAGIGPPLLLVSSSIDEGQRAADACAAGRPAVGYVEWFLESAVDPWLAPPGKHLLSVFAQYAPYELATGDWASRRQEIQRLVLDRLAEAIPDLDDIVEAVELVGPADLEERLGLTRGDMYHGAMSPGQVWDRRFGPRTPLDGVYLCGAAAHPGPCVVGLPGRNAAMAILADLRAWKASTARATRHAPAATPP